MRIAKFCRRDVISEDIVSAGVKTETSQTPQCGKFLVFLDCAQEGSLVCDELV